ncbi:MAG TPA: Holliday junction branch migration protein RuvA [Thermoanaerobaculia bacterium]|nr:Holliday junction branch migration protein RuvA [Thermoanaerobaculia bacterium]
MIGYLEGKLLRLEPGRAVIMTGGVGYEVHIPLSTYYRLEGKSAASLEIHTHVRDDAIALYGFSTSAEKDAFEKLISISGIGPRLAQVILSGIEVGELADAIVRGDSRRLSAIPGVGRKTSERLCLELRDKLLAPVDSGGRAATPTPPPATLDDDVVSALMNLGYKQPSAEAAVRTARQQVEGEPELSALLRAALRQLNR